MTPNEQSNAGSGMKETREFLDSFRIENGLIQLSIGSLDRAMYLDEIPAMEPDSQNRNIFFSPAARKRRGSEKKDVLGSRYLWVDVDDLVMPEPTYPPTYIVNSGHGWHLYWRLAEPCTDSQLIEAMNKILIGDIPTADIACWNANRLMRVPNTMNAGDPGKDEEPVMSVLHHRNNITYDIADFGVLAGLSNEVRGLIRTGERGAYPSRSERDWAVIFALLVSGASDTLIRLIYTRTQVGNKYRDHNTPDHYLEHTIKNARESIAKEPPAEGEQPNTKARKDRRGGQAAGETHAQIVERPEGYWLIGRSQKPLSTFVLDPLYRLQPIEEGAQEAIVCNVISQGIIYQNVTFPKKAFTAVPEFDRALPSADWQWTGGETTLRELLPYLLARLREKNNGMTRQIAATNVLGMHLLETETPTFVTDTITITAKEVLPSDMATITWLPNRRTHPTLDLSVSSENDFSILRDVLPQINKPTVVQTLIGWYTSCLLKPWLEAQNVRMPILNITGTKGSGKTTISQRIMMPLFGQPNPIGYDSATTKFVKIALLGSTNAVPIAFSEFRQYDPHALGFIRMMLMAYDNGHDARGRGDQSTVEYPLTAPFSVDGEDVIDDSAARERIVVARLRPDTVAEGSEAYAAFQQLRNNLPKHFAGHLVQRLLQMITDGTALTRLHEARKEFYDAFPTKLPDRVRNNYTVVYFGAKLFAEIVGATPPQPQVFEESMREIVQLDSGRSKTLIDDFVEAISIAIRQNPGSGFQWRYAKANEKHGNVMYVHITGAHSWWLQQRTRQKRGVMERDSLIAQLTEAPYYVGRKPQDGMIMYGVDLTAAAELGLDVPTMLSSMTIEMPI